MNSGDCQVPNKQNTFFFFTIFIDLITLIVLLIKTDLYQPVMDMFCDSIQTDIKLSCHIEREQSLFHELRLKGWVLLMICTVCIWCLCVQV